MRAASARSGLQDSAVRQERLERGGIAAVALFAADVTAAVGRTIPIREMVRSGGLGSGEMAISTPALLRHCRCREQEQPYCDAITAAPRSHGMFRARCRLRVRTPRDPLPAHVQTFG